jgi:hypothetical protein
MGAVSVSVSPRPLDDRVEGAENGSTGSKNVLPVSVVDRFAPPVYAYV